VPSRIRIVAGALGYFVLSHECGQNRLQGRPFGCVALSVQCKGRGFFKMDDKDRFEAYMKLADFYRERESSRRQLEWKISLALWALIVAAIYSIKARPPEWAIIVSLVFIVLIHTGLWVWHFWVRSEGTSRVTQRYIWRAEHIVRGDKEEPKPAKPRTLMDSIFSMTPSIVQFLTTLFLAITAYFLIGTKVIH